MADNNEVSLTTVATADGTGSLTITSRDGAAGVKYAPFRDAHGTHLEVEVWIGEERARFSACVTKEQWPFVVIDMAAPVRQEGV